MNDIHRLTHQDAIRINNQVLALHCHSDADGCAVYEDGWSDERVLKEAERVLKRGLSMLAISALRRDGFGNFRREQRLGRPLLVPRVEALETKVAKQQELIEALQAQLSSMALWLKHNKGYAYTAPQGRPPATPPNILNGP
jgi:hypothetical protein